MNPIFVAEFTTNHMGNLNVLLRMVEKAAEAGASLIKMQKKDVENFYSQEKLNSSFLSPYGKTYRDYRSIFEFSLDDHKRFDKHCRDYGIGWFATAQDKSSLDFLIEFDLPMYKVASCNATDLDFIQYIMSRTDKPLVVSTGGTNLDDIDKVVELVDRPLHILQCTSTYPCPLEDLHLGNIPILKERYANQAHVSVGYSGHELGIEPSILAAKLGAEMIERHFTLTRTTFVHHIECSIEPEEYKKMVSRIHTNNFIIGLSSEEIEKASKVHFGMTKSQEKFLVDNTYSCEMLGNKIAKIIKRMDVPSYYGFNNIVINRINSESVENYF